MVLANVEGEGVSIGQNLSANFALVLWVAIAGENLFLVMHRDEVQVEQILVLGLLITEVTREKFWRLWGWRRRGGSGQSFWVGKSIACHHCHNCRCWCGHSPILLLVPQMERIPALLLHPR